jgi:hypothetical protein
MMCKGCRQQALRSMRVMGTREGHTNRTVAEVSAGYAICFTCKKDTLKARLCSEVRPPTAGERVAQLAVVKTLAPAARAGETVMRDMCTYVYPWHAQ